MALKHKQPQFPAEATSLNRTHARRLMLADGAIYSNTTSYALLRMTTNRHTH